LDLSLPPAVGDDTRLSRSPVSPDSEHGGDDAENEGSAGHGQPPHRDPLIQR
jgi:hypothetical protein